MDASQQTRFDWYEATIDGVDDGRVAAAIALAMRGNVTRGRARNGYAACWSVERGEDTVAQVLGHSARRGEVHIVTTSESCDTVVPLIRRHWSVHRVSRVDSSIDFEADFSALDDVAVNFAMDRGLRYRLVTDSTGGATRYLGSPRSEVQVRIYRKSEQLRQLHPDRADQIPDGIVRCELQARPGKSEAKSAAAVLLPDDVWGLSRWTRDLAASILHVDAQRTATHFRRPSDWSRAMHFLGAQYGPLIARRAADHDLATVRAEVLATLGLDGYQGRGDRSRDGNG